MRVVTKESERFLAILQLDLLEGLLDYFFNNQLVHFLHAGSCHLSTCVACALLAADSLRRLSMLGRDDHSVDLAWFHRTILFLQVLNGHLRLAIRTQPPQLTI